MSKTISNDNFFRYKKGTKYIILIDKKGSLSGETMKQLNYRQPDTITKLRAKLNDETKIGSCFLIDLCLFIVARNNYRCKWDEDILAAIFNKLNPQLKKTNYMFRIDTEDYPIVDKFLDENLNITVCNHCEWGK